MLAFWVVMPCGFAGNAFTFTAEDGFSMILQNADIYNLQSNSITNYSKYLQLVDTNLLGCNVTWISKYCLHLHS
jgi:hypothetical protein